MANVNLDSIKWIQGDPDCGSPVFLRKFSLEGCDKAQIAICGLGYFELYLNGKKVTEDMLNPVWSNYQPRDIKRLLYPIKDEMSCRVYYRLYDITELVKKGENRLGVWLGNGWYNQYEKNVEGEMRYGTPRLAFRISAFVTTVRKS